MQCGTVARPYFSKPSPDCQKPATPVQDFERENASLWDVFFPQTEKRF
jgi:hypothetical protein